MNSVWLEGVEKTKFQSLSGIIKTDVLVIGGGICGLLCGSMLKRAGVDCLVAESKEICGSVTGDTTAKITFQNGIIYDDIFNSYGKDGATAYFNAHKSALEEYKKLCSDIDCDFKESSATVFSLKGKEKIEKELSAYQKLGVDAELNKKSVLPIKIDSAVTVKNQGEFNPLKFAYSIAKELNILEHTKIIEIRDNCAVAENGKIFAKKIIVATHFPFINKYGGYFLKLYQHRSYVLALKNAQDVGGMYVDENIKGLSFRNYKDLLLLGGGSHRTGKKGGNWQELEEFRKKYYPQSTVVARWATQDCMSLDGIPYIGRYSESTPNLYVATGFNKWGMTSSMVAAMVLRDSILGKENENAFVFSPQRSIFKPQLAINVGESLLGILKPTAPRCPHLGCALNYNKAEHSWDCSCHGSRFTATGKLLNNPATSDKKDM